MLEFLSCMLAYDNSGVDFPLEEFVTNLKKLILRKVQNYPFGDWSQKRPIGARKGPWSL